VLHVGLSGDAVYRFRTILNAADPTARNRARAEALQLLRNARR